MSFYDELFFVLERFRYKTCEGWGKVLLCKKSGNQSVTEPRLTNKAFVELNFTVNLEVGNLVAAVYQPKGSTYISKMIKLYGEKVHI